jgi:hypothetical protein
MTYDDLMDGREQQFALEHEAEAIRVRDEARTAFVQRAAWEAHQSTIDTDSTTYTSEPLPGVQSPFFAGDRYYANPEDARRARIDLADVAALEARLTAIALAAVDVALRRVA